MRAFLISLALLLWPALAGAQQMQLDGAAESARQAWFEHDARALVADAPRLLVQLPGADPSIALGPAQARQATRPAAGLPADARAIASAYQPTSARSR